MTFPSILPHLHSGRKVRRREWAERPGLAGLLQLGGGSEVALLVADLLSSDWELVEEPVTVTAAPHICAGSCQSAIDAAATIQLQATNMRDQQHIIASRDGEISRLDATITRLTEQRDAQQRGVLAMEEQRNAAVLQVDRLTRELAEAQRRYITLHDAVVATVSRP